MLSSTSLSLKTQSRIKGEDLKPIKRMLFSHLLYFPTMLIVLVTYFLLLNYKEELFKSIIVDIPSWKIEFSSISLGIVSLIFIITFLTLEHKLTSDINKKWKFENGEHILLSSIESSNVSSKSVAKIAFPAGFLFAISPKNVRRDLLMLIIVITFAFTLYIFVRAILKMSHLEKKVSSYNKLNLFFYQFLILFLILSVYMSFFLSTVTKNHYVTLYDVWTDGLLPYLSIIAIPFFPLVALYIPVNKKRWKKMVELANEQSSVQKHLFIYSLYLILFAAWLVCIISSALSAFA